MKGAIMDFNKLTADMNSIPGHLGFYYKNLITGEEYGVRESEQYGAASVIKLPIFMCIAKWAAEGKADLSEKIKVNRDVMVPICGALTLFTDEPEVSILTLCRLMISISDNTATNVLIARFGIPAYQEEFKKIGLKDTQLLRRLFDDAASAKGIENKIVPKEMGMLLEKVYRKEFVNEETSKLIMDTLMLQQINHKLGGKIDCLADIAHKTGEDWKLSNDVGIVLAKQPFIACYAGHDTDVYLWEDFIRRSSYDLCVENNK